MSPPVSTSIPWAVWQSTITQWAQRASGLSVVWARQAENAPQVRKPYVLLDMISITRRGQSDGVKMIDDGAGNIDFATYGIRRIVLNVQVVANAHGSLADSAYVWAEELQNSIDTTPDLQPFVQVGLGVVDVSSIRDLGSIEQSQYVSRVTFDITFEGAIANRGTWTGPPIERAIGTGELEGDATPELSFDTENQE